VVCKLFCSSCQRLQMADAAGTDMVVATAMWLCVVLVFIALKAETDRDVHRCLPITKHGGAVQAAACAPRYSALGECAFKCVAVETRRC
jgi:hypothetical protein